MVTLDPEFEQLLLLKLVTQKMGTLHEAQKVQLQYWPLIMTSATKSEFAFSFEDKTIIFNLAEFKGRMPKNMPERLQHLSDCTKRLLGDEYLVVIKADGKTIFKSTGKNNVPRKVNTKTRPKRTRKR